jgi:hypothetical protein
MLGFQLKGSLGKRKKLKNIFIEGIIINNTVFYEADINTIIAIGYFLNITLGKVRKGKVRLG